MDMLTVMSDVNATSKFMARCRMNTDGRPCSRCECNDRCLADPAIEETYEIEQNCKEFGCGKPFVITQGEIEWYTSPHRNLALPKRCPDCRKKRKERKNG